MFFMFANQLFIFSDTPERRRPVVSSDSLQNLLKVTDGKKYSGVVLE